MAAKEGKILYLIQGNTPVRDFVRAPSVAVSDGGREGAPMALGEVKRGRGVTLGLTKRSEGFQQNAHQEPFPRKEGTDGGGGETSLPRR